MTPISSTTVGAIGRKVGETLGGYIYDNPESARHPDTETPAGNIINNALGY